MFLSFNIMLFILCKPIFIFSKSSLFFFINLSLSSLDSPNVFSCLTLANFWKKICLTKLISIDVVSSLIGLKCSLFPNLDLLNLILTLFSFSINFLTWVIDHHCIYFFSVFWVILRHFSDLLIFWCTTSLVCSEHNPRGLRFLSRKSTRWDIIIWNFHLIVGLYPISDEYGLFITGTVCSFLCGCATLWLVFASISVLFSPVQTLWFNTSSKLFLTLKTQNFNYLPYP